MPSGRFSFENFDLDPADRQLRRDNVPIELNARYFDALALLVREQGKLVSKDRFLEEVWRGIAVTDEALTQCIKTIRKLLGDNAASPRFIETVPKHGYRFIASVAWIDEKAMVDAATMAATVAGALASQTIVSGPHTLQTTTRTTSGTPTSQMTASGTPPIQTASQSRAQYSWQQFFLLGGSGTMGGGIAGLLGGVFYGFAGYSQSLQSGMGAVSVLLVIVCLSIVAGLIGGAGVAFGIAAAGFAPGRTWQWSILGGALGGMLVGAFVKMLGLDAFNLLLGQSPGDITGAAEGTLLGAAVGFALWLGSRNTEAPLLKRSIITATLTGTTASILIHLLGGRLMGGSLDLLARSFSNSRFHLEQIGSLFGESDFGPISQIVTGGFEGALFSGCIVAAMLVVRRRLSLNG